MDPKLYWIKKSPSGALAISARPRGNDWLDDEITGWRKQGIDVIVSLLTDGENADLGLRQERAVAIQKGISFYRFPVEDRGVPQSLSSTEELAAKINSEMQQGRKVAIHCRQGIGRSSLIAAAVLVSGGADLTQSLNAIREARGVDVPETKEQREWLGQFAKTRTAGTLR